MRGVLSAVDPPPDWDVHRLDGVFTRRKVTGHEDLEPLSVFTGLGVVPRSSQDWSYKALGESLATNLLVEPGDIVFNKLRTWQGAIGVSSHRGIMSPAYFVCRLRSPGDPRYFHFLLRSAPWVRELMRLSKWMPPNQNDISWEDLKTIELLVPPPPVQTRIADYLDRETARIDAVILAKRRMAELLQERSSLAFDCALRGHGFEFPAELAPDWAQYPRPEDWAIMNLSQVLVQLTNGFVGPTRDILVDEGVPYVQSLHIKNGKIDFARRPFYVAQAWHDSRARIHLRQEDVLIVQTGDIGQVAVVPPGFGSASCHALQIARVKQDVITGRYLAAFLRSPFGRQSLLSRATGALHPHLEAGIKDIPIVVPPLSIQAIVVAEVERDELRALKWISVLDCQTKLLQERRQALVTAAVTGDLDIPEAA